MQVVWFWVERSKVNVRVRDYVGLTAILCGFKLFECSLVIRGHAFTVLNLIFFVGLYV